MRVGEVVIDTDHAVVFVCVALVRSDQVPGSVTLVCSIRRRNEREKLLYPRVNSDGNAPVRSGVGAGPRVAGGRQQTLMRKDIGHRGNCCRCLYFAEALIVCKKESAVMHYRAADASAELVAHEWWDRGATQIKVILGIEGSISMQFEQRSVELIAS